MNELNYGQGKISIMPNTNVLGFDITYTGKFNGNVLLNADWIVSSNDKRIIGFTVNASIDEPVDIIEYSGDITVNTCFVANMIDMFECKIVYNPGDNLFEDSEETFNTSTQKLNEMKKTYTPRKRDKTSLQHINLLTKHGEYYFPDGTSVPEGTGYSITLNPRQALVGGKPIYQKLDNQKLLNFSKIKKPKPLKLKPVALKKYVKSVKEKASASSSGHVTAGQRADVAQDPTYSGGGSD